jgi:hypothetical protein
VAADFAMASRDESARALERVETRAVHKREPYARLGLGEGAIVRVV